ncbi:MAG TPA: serine/threonine-protein kinase [Polyangiales bacterium]|nr:serine/threonine-protein kinase [Polyangiales bacterium]
MAPTSDAPGGASPLCRPRAPLIDRYELLSELASGGMATIYAARDRGAVGFEDIVAIKTLHPHLRRDRGLVEMFLDEARLAARIQHANVIAALDSGCDAHGHPFIAMEYVAGEQLGALLRRAGEAGKRIAPQIGLRIVLDALRGLAAAHALCDERGRSLGLVHRDVSPQNILIGLDGRARITDFGVAKAEGRLHVTRTDVVKGKLSYMAPEQAAGRELDQRADLFAMGIVLWEALTRRRLFVAEDSADVFRRVLYAPIPAPSSVHRSLAPLDQLLARALARDPDSRFASAEEFAAALELAAQPFGGVASHAVVAKLVGRLASEKLEAERARMRSAAALLDDDDPDERSETRRLGRADGIGRESGAPALLSERPSVISSALREMTFPRWLGVVAALLIGALGTALIPAPAPRPQVARGMQAAPRDAKAAKTGKTGKTLSVPLRVAHEPAVARAAGTAVAAPPQAETAVPANRAALPLR